MSEDTLPLSSHTEQLLESTQSESTSTPLQRERREWSKLISVVGWIAFLTCLVALVVIITLIAIPGVVGFSHKNYIVGILSLFFVCGILLLYKARNDSRSLIFISIINLALACFVIGFGSGQLVRHLHIQKQ